MVFSDGPLTLEFTALNRKTEESLALQSIVYSSSVTEVEYVDIYNVVTRTKTVYKFQF